MTAVLIVDDDDAFRSTLGRDLARQGFSVSLARNVEEALSLLTSQVVDVLLTDLRMPGADGIDLLGNVRSISSRTRTILMSGFASARDYQRAIECGAVRVLCKPFTSSELLQAIRQAEDCETGFRGSIHGLSLVDLLQMFHFARRSLAIVVDSWAPGHVFLEEGQIIHAVYREQTGEAALRAILAMPAGSLRTMVLPDGTPRTITRDVASLLLDVLRTLDEARSQVDDDLLFDEIVHAPPSFDKLRSIDGYTAACLVDAESGVVIGSDAEAVRFDLQIAATGFSELLRLQRDAVGAIAPDDRVESIQITLSGQYHILHAIAAKPTLFLYVVVDRQVGNLGLLRYALMAQEAALDV